MTIKGIAIALGLSFLIAAQAHSSIIFEFAWTGDPSEDSTIVSSENTTLRASGTIEIDAAAGETFALADILATSILVTGDMIEDFVFSSWNSAGGLISDDGLSALFLSSGNPFFSDGGDFFGCAFIGCGDDGGTSTSDLLVEVSSGGFTSSVLYGSFEDALASMQMTTNAAVPLPATFALVLLGLMACLRMRQSRRLG